LYVALAVLLFAGAWADPFHEVPGDPSDSALWLWFLRWFPFSIEHGLNPFVTNYIDYPSGVNLLWNGSMPLIGVLMAPVTLTLGTIFAYNVLITLSVGFSAWAAYLLIRRYVQKPFAAIVGGLLYGFSPYMMGHSLGHPVLTLVVIPPLIFLALDEILVRQRRSPRAMGIVLGLLASAQLLISQEMLAITALTAFLGVLLLAALNLDEVRVRAGYAVRAISVAAACFLVVSALPLGVEFFGPQRVAGIVQGPNTFVSDLLSFVVPTRLQALAPSWAIDISDRFTGGRGEATNSYLGLALIAVLFYTAVRRWSDPVTRFATLLAGLIATLSLGQTIHIGGHVTNIPVFVLGLALPVLQRILPARLLLYALVGTWLGLIHLPLLDNLLPARLMVVVYLLLAIVLAAFVEIVLIETRPGGRAAGWVALGAALLLLLPAWPFKATTTPLPSFFTSSAVDRIPAGTVALVAPFTRSLSRPVAMYWQAAASMRFRMPEGYQFVPGGAEPYQPGGSSPNPPPSATQMEMFGIEQGRESGVVTPELRSRVLSELDRWNVRTVIVGPMRHQDRMLALFTALLGTPEEVGGVDVWWQVDAARLLTERPG
jgi:hypothetical protein